MIWAEVTYANVLSHMPTDVLTSYNAWLVANPDRADRLATITANTVREFRDAIKSNPANVVYDDEDYLPQSCIRHCENIIIFTLGMEMGLTMDEQGNSSRVAADIFLRMIPQGKWNTTTNDDADIPTPRYSVPATSAGQVLAALVALLLGAATARGGWIKPDGAPTYDTELATTFTPSAYTITTATLFGHLYGINAALATKTTEAFVTNAIAQATNGVVDADARLMASSANYTAASAIAGLGARLSVGGGILTGPLTMTTNLLTVGSIILGTNAPVTNWPSGASQWSFSAASTNLNMAGTNDIINVRQIIGEDTSFWINMDENGGLLDSSVDSEWRVVRGLTVGSTLNVPSIALGTNAAVSNWPAGGTGSGATQLIVNVTGQAPGTSTYNAGTATLTLTDLAAPTGASGGSPKTLGSAAAMWSIINTNNAKWLTYVVTNAATRINFPLDTGGMVDSISLVGADGISVTQATIVARAYVAAGSEWGTVGLKTTFNGVTLTNVITLTNSLTTQLVALAHAPMTGTCATTFSWGFAPTSAVGTAVGNVRAAVFQIRGSW